MCAGCNADVAATGEYIDRLLAVEKERRARHSDETNAQHTVGLACIVLDAYAESPDKIDAVMNMAMGLALMTTRMLAAQEIYGAAFS
jgi:hypothetical protein